MFRSDVPASVAAFGRVSLLTMAAVWLAVPVLLAAGYLSRWLGPPDGASAVGRPRRGRVVPLRAPGQGADGAVDRRAAPRLRGHLSYLLLSDRTLSFRVFGAAGAVLVWYAVPRVFDTYRDYVVASLPGDQRHQYRTRTSGAVPLVVFSAVLLLVVVAKTTTAILALLVLVVWCASAFYRHYPTLLWVLAVWLNYPDGRAPTWTPRDSRIASHATLHAFTAALVLLVTTTCHFGAPTELMALFFSPRGVPHHYWLV